MRTADFGTRVGVLLNAELHVGSPNDEVSTLLGVNQPQAIRVKASDFRA